MGIDVRWGAAAQCEILLSISAPRGVSILRACSSNSGTSLAVIDSTMQCHVFRVWHPREGVPQLRQVRAVVPRTECLATFALPNARQGTTTAAALKATFLVRCGQTHDGDDLFAVIFPSAPSTPGDRLSGAAVHSLLVPACTAASLGTHNQHRPWLQEDEPNSSGVQLGPAWPIAGVALSAAAAVPCPSSPAGGVLLSEGGSGGACSGVSLWCPISRTVLAVLGQGSLPPAAVRSLHVAPLLLPAGGGVAHAVGLCSATSQAGNAAALHHITVTASGSVVPRSDGSVAPCSWAWALKASGMQQAVCVGQALQAHTGGVNLFHRGFLTWEGQSVAHLGLPPQVPSSGTSVASADSDSPRETVTPPCRLIEGEGAADDGSRKEVPPTQYTCSDQLSVEIQVEPPSEARDPPLDTPHSPCGPSPHAGAPDTPSPPAESEADVEPLPESNQPPAPSDHPLALRGGVAPTPTVKHTPLTTAPSAQHDEGKQEEQEQGHAYPCCSDGGAEAARRGRLRSLQTARRRLKRSRGKYGRRVSTAGGEAECIAKHAGGSGDSNNQVHIASVQRVLGQHPRDALPADAQIPAVVECVGPLVQPGVASTQPGSLSGQPAHPLAAPTLHSLQLLDDEIRQVQASEFDAVAAERWVRARRRAKGHSLATCAGSALYIAPNEAALAGTEQEQAAILAAFATRQAARGWRAQ